MHLCWLILFQLFFKLLYFCEVKLFLAFVLSLFQGVLLKEVFHAFIYWLQAAFFVCFYFVTVVQFKNRCRFLNIVLIGNRVITCAWFCFDDSWVLASSMVNRQFFTWLFFLNKNAPILARNMSRAFFPIKCDQMSIPPIFIRLVHAGTSSLIIDQRLPTMHGTLICHNKRRNWLDIFLTTTNIEIGFCFVNGGFERSCQFFVKVTLFCGLLRWWQICIFHENGVLLTHKFIGILMFAAKFFDAFGSMVLAKIVAWEHCEFMINYYCYIKANNFILYDQFFELLGNSFKIIILITWKYCKSEVKLSLSLRFEITEMRRELKKCIISETDHLEHAFVLFLQTDVSGHYVL